MAIGLQFTWFAQILICYLVTLIMILSCHGGIVFIPCRMYTVIIVN